MVKCLLLMTLCMAIPACGPAYPDDLARRLDGKTADQKRAILAEECGAAIADSVRRALPSERRDPAGMRRICEEMTGREIP
jgi:hypothetical protein